MNYPETQGRIRNDNYEAFNYEAFPPSASKTRQVLARRCGAAGKA